VLDLSDSQLLFFASAVPFLFDSGDIELHLNTQSLMHSFSDRGTVIIFIFPESGVVSSAIAPMDLSSLLNELRNDQGINAVKAVKDVPVFKGAQRPMLLKDYIAGKTCPPTATEYAFEEKHAVNFLIDSAKDFGCDIVSGFTGRLIDVPIPENIERFKAVWTPLAERAADKGVRIAWENCHMGGNWLTGNWNIAHNPDAWELMFDALPMDNVGLEWEPCHQMVQLIQPLPQIREWKKRLFHIHGKDATVRWDLISRHGIGGSECFSWHRTPGFGDTNWTDIISELRFVGYEGSIDIEGWHDPVYKNHLEMTGQVHALKYLKECRGGEFIEF
jgi:sugar phosphate isomerase/epimerase